MRLCGRSLWLAARRFDVRFDLLSRRRLRADAFLLPAARG